MSYYISAIDILGGAINQFRIRRDDAAGMPAWQAGAHVKLHLSGVDGRSLERHYSLVGVPGNCKEYRIAVLHDPDGQGGSSHLHEQLSVGDNIVLSGPYNTFVLAPARGRTVLLAGGIGITPLISMAHCLSQAEAGRVELHYLARSKERLVLIDELAELPSVRLSLHVKDQRGARADLASILGSYTEGAALYACGPASMLQAARQSATDLGWPAHALHFESFGMRAAAGDKVVQVHLVQSELTIEVAPGTSILDAMIDAGAFVSYHCKRGECGSCYATVLDGVPAHRDVCLSPPQRAAGMCTCVSWAASGRIVLDM